MSNMKNRISCLRKQCSLSQEELAEILRISQSSLSKYEKDRLAIPSAVLIQMSNQIVKLTSDRASSMLTSHFSDID